MISLTGPFHAVFEEVGGQLRALLLVAVGIRAVPVGVPLRCRLELGSRGGVLGGQRRSIHVISIIDLRLGRSASSPRALPWRWTTRGVLRSPRGTAEVLVRELVGETSVWVVGARRVGSRLVGTVLSSGVVVGGGLRCVLCRIRVLHEISLRGVSSTVVGLRRRLATARLLLAGRWREHGLGKGRGSGGKGSVGLQMPLAVPKVEMQTVVIGVHLGVP